MKFGAEVQQAFLNVVLGVEPDTGTAYPALCYFCNGLHQFSSDLSSGLGMFDEGFQSLRGNVHTPNGEIAARYYNES